jgi:hypothetical protein
VGCRGPARHGNASCILAQKDGHAEEQIVEKRFQRDLPCAAFSPRTPCIFSQSPLRFFQGDHCIVKDLRIKDMLKNKIMVIVAACKRWNSVNGEMFVFPHKRRIDGVGSRTVEFIEGTYELVDASMLDEQGRLLGTR